MLKLPFVLVLLVVGQNHAKPSSIGQQKLMEYRSMLVAAEKESQDYASETGNWEFDNVITADNTAGDSTKGDCQPVGAPCSEDLPCCATLLCWTWGKTACLAPGGPLGKK